jgi:hypothetical protein
MVETGGDAGWLVANSSLCVTLSVERQRFERAGPNAHHIPCSPLGQSRDQGLVPLVTGVIRRSDHGTTSTALGGACGLPPTIHVVGQTETAAGASSLPLVSMQRLHFAALYVSWLSCITSYGQACTQLAPHIMDRFPLRMASSFGNPRWISPKLCTRARGPRRGI